MDSVLLSLPDSTEIRSDALQPCGEFLRILQVAQRLVGLEQSVLGDILSLGEVLHPVVCQAVDSAVVSNYESVETSVIAPEGFCYKL